MIDERLMLYAANALWQPVAVALLALVLARLTRRLEAGAAAPLYLSAIVMAAVIPALSFPGFPAGTAVFTFSAEALAGGPSKTPALPLAAIAFAVLILARAVWLCAGLARLYSLRAAKGIVVSEAATAPMTFGVFRPVVIWPAALWKGIAAPVRRAILAHERAHIARHDFAWNLAVEVLTLGIWWHPAVVWLKRRWAAEREFACDRVAARRVPGYAAALFDAAKRIAGATPYPALGLFDSTVFEERMMKLTRSAKTLGGPAARTLKLTALGLLAVSAVFLAVHPVALAQQDEPVLRVGGFSPAGGEGRAGVHRRGPRRQGGRNHRSGGRNFFEGIGGRSGSDQRHRLRS